MKLKVIASMLFLVVPSAIQAQTTDRASSGAVTVRTEVFPRPPYSGATYYIYERDGSVICTKLSVCNKFNDCDVTYSRGSYKDPEDVQTGQPFSTSPAVSIATASLLKHVCLTRYGLVNRR